MINGPPPRARGGSRALPSRDPEGDFITPPGGDITDPQVAREYSPLLKRIREGKRGADRLEECLTRGIRKARGQWVTPRKKRNTRGARASSPAPDLVLDHGPRVPGGPQSQDRESRNGSGGHPGTGPSAPTGPPVVGTQGQGGAGAIRGKEALASSSAVPPGENGDGLAAPSPSRGGAPGSPARGTKRPALGPAEGDPEGPPPDPGPGGPP